MHGIRDQLSRKVDLPIAELAGRRDGDVVTVGGIVGFRGRGLEINGFGGNDRICGGAVGDLIRGARATTT